MLSYNQLFTCDIESIKKEYFFQIPNTYLLSIVDELFTSVDIDKNHKFSLESYHQVYIDISKLPIINTLIEYKKSHSYVPSSLPTFSPFYKDSLPFNYICIDNNYSESLLMNYLYLTISPELEFDNIKFHNYINTYKEDYYIDEIIKLNLLIDFEGYRVLFIVYINMMNNYVDSIFVRYNTFPLSEKYNSPSDIEYIDDCLSFDEKYQRAIKYITDVSVDYHYMYKPDSVVFINIDCILLENYALFPKKESNPYYYNDNYTSDYNFTLNSTFFITFHKEEVKFTHNYIYEYKLTKNRCIFLKDESEFLSIINNILLYKNMPNSSMIMIIDSVFRDSNYINTYRTEESIILIKPNVELLDIDIIYSFKDMESFIKYEKFMYSIIEMKYKLLNRNYESHIISNNIEYILSISKLSINYLNDRGIDNPYNVSRLSHNESTIVEIYLVPNILFEDYSDTCSKDLFDQSKHEKKFFLLKQCENYHSIDYDEYKNKNDHKDENNFIYDDDFLLERKDLILYINIPMEIYSVSTINHRKYYSRCDEYRLRINSIFNLNNQIVKHISRYTNSNIILCREYRKNVLSFIDDYIDDFNENMDDSDLNNKSSISGPYIEFKMRDIRFKKVKSINY